uniref:AlNc14C57G4286 protein n=1 Tax=Albugo laibachii Nc14 TaxID=890382 RepID=F0WCA3_9STRA|nr:AlNc14C57G4286 [Albugo laibachii Nc14]|eukprot:CCA18817.1 AlNc14C57G4286 [Albugo laibachii Nc14]
MLQQLSLFLILFSNESCRCCIVYGLTGYVLKKSAPYFWISYVFPRFNQAIVQLSIKR